MGTNYYLRENECKCCGRYDEVHVGKQSAGWRFLFNGKKYKTVADVRRAISTGQLFDEYGRPVEPESFFIRVFDRNGEKSHRDSMIGVDVYRFWEDEGYEFYAADFS